MLNRGKSGPGRDGKLTRLLSGCFFLPPFKHSCEIWKRDQQITCVCLLLSICAQKHSNHSWCTIYQEFNASKFVVFTSLLLFSILFTLQLDRVLCFHEHYHQYVFHHHQHHCQKKDCIRILSRTAGITIFWPQWARQSLHIHQKLFSVVIFSREKIWEPDLGLAAVIWLQFSSAEWKYQKSTHPCS